ncbi:MAG TPA: flagellar basal body-associated FliL family protein [Solimonas sp.]|nr:flagellar basal body-associated FliL family protein [Solimonas sp.]
MASAATATDEDVPKPAVKAKKTGGSPLLAIALAVVVSTAASAGVSFMLTRHALAAAAHADATAEGEAGDKAAADKPKDPPNYLPLDPAFVVNLEADDTRFLQVQVQLMTRDAHAVDTLKLHEPRIRNALLMLFSQQHPADIATLAGKQKLQAESLDQIRKILVEETGKPLVEAVYFTSFVTQ